MLRLLATLTILLEIGLGVLASDEDINESKLMRRLGEWIPTPRPTWNPTPRPTWQQTPRPTWNPTPKPTDKPTPRPTWNPTPRPTKATPRPTWRPTPRPTWRPTPKPTTPRPTWSPTPKPTLSPTMDYCKNIKPNSAVQLVVSNECVFPSDNECNAMRQFLRDVAELTFSPQVSQYIVRNHFGAQFGGDFSQRENLLAQLDSFPCYPGANQDNVNYYHALDSALNSLLGASHFTGQKEIVIISFCNDPQETYNQNGQITCDVPKQKSPDQMKQIEIGVVNIGPANNNNEDYFDVKDQFSCLVDPHYPQDLVNIFRGDLNTLTTYYPYLQKVENIICRMRTPQPTPRPTWNPTPKPIPPTPRPTWRPTPKPSPRPTWDTPNPTPRPTWRPTPRPTWNPTPKPTTPKPTPRPTWDPTPEPTPRPTPRPTWEPTPEPTVRPTPRPTWDPTPRPTWNPTPDPTIRPTPRPTWEPTPEPTNRPTPRPTWNPTPRPTWNPTPRPTWNPTPRPTWEPTPEPTNRPTPRPTWDPTPEPTEKPTPRPTWNPTPRPTWDPTPNPTLEPTTPKPTPRPTWDTPNPTPKPTPRPSWNTPNPTPKPTPRPSWNTPNPTGKPTVWSAPSPPPNDDCGHGGNADTCSNGKKATFDIVEESKCDDLWARWGNYYYVAGQVCVTKVDDDNVNIKYTTKDGWYLKETHAWFGCDEDGYPQYSGTYDNYPKLSEFPMVDDDLSYPTTEYDVTTSISSASGCNYLNYCDYCDTVDELLFYVIAQAKLKYYYHGYWYYKTAYMEGDWIYYYNGYWALQHQLLVDVDCC